MDPKERTAPKAIELVRFGVNHFTRDGKPGEFDFTPGDADKIIREFSERKRDVVIDYEHQSLSGGEAPAAGWIDRLEKTATGLNAHVKYWTDKALDHLKNGAYRYSSPTLLFSADNNVTALHSVALTNHPALHGMKALVANDLGILTNNLSDLSASDLSDVNPKGKLTMTMTKTEIALRKLLGDTALALSDTADETVAHRIEALADELPGLRAKAAECDTLKNTAVDQKRTLLLNDAKARCAISEATAKSLEKSDVVWLEAHLKTLADNSAVPGGKLPETPADDGKNKPALTDDEKEMARRMNLTDEEFLAAKKNVQDKED